MINGFYRNDAQSQCLALRDSRIENSISVKQRPILVV